MNPNDLFEEYFAGVWRRRWLPVGPRLVEITSYRTGRITDEIVEVIGHADDGTRCTFEIGRGQRRLLGPFYRKDTPA
jgi:hypothetical protein